MEGGEYSSAEDICNTAEVLARSIVSSNETIPKEGRGGKGRHS